MYGRFYGGVLKDIRNFKIDWEFNKVRTQMVCSRFERIRRKYASWNHISNHGQRIKLQKRNHKSKIKLKSKGLKGTGEIRALP